MHRFWLADRITPVQEVSVLSHRLVTPLALAAILVIPCVDAAHAAAEWVLAPVGSSGFAQGHNATSVAVDGQGQSRIAYYEGVGRDLVYAEKTAGGWVLTTVDTTGDTGRWASLEIDSQGNPHIAYYYFLDPNDAPICDLKYAWRSGGTWTIQTVEATNNIGEYCSLELDSQNNPHISYYDNTNGNLRYARKSGGTWTPESVEATGNVGLYSALALDAANNPRIAYQDFGTAGADGHLRYASKSGSTWTLETPSGATFVNALFISLDLDSQGRPHIAYYDQNNQRTRYATKPTTTWSHGIAQAVGAELHGSFCSIEIGEGDVPHLGYYDVFENAVRYAIKNANGGAAWAPQVVDEIGPQGPWTSLALDANGFPHMSFYAPAITEVVSAFFTDNTSDTFQERQAFMSLDAFPNPVRASTQLVLRTPRSVPVGLTVMDARGRLVRSFAARELSPGTHSFAWDGRDETGTPVAAGVYFAVTRPEWLATARKLVVVR